MVGGGGETNGWVRCRERSARGVQEGWEGYAELVDEMVEVLHLSLEACDLVGEAVGFVHAAVQHRSGHHAL